MAPTSDNSRRKKLPPWLLQTLGYLLAVACLIWAYHDADPGQIARDFRSLDGRWATLAILFDLSIYVCGGWRWKVLLKPIADVSFWRTVQSIYIGLFANEVLPLRTGEIVRGYLLSYWNRVPLSLSLSTVAIERLFDGFWLVSGFAVTSFLVALPQWLVAIARITAVGIACILLFLVAVVAWKERARGLVAKHRWAHPLELILDGLHAIGNRRTILATLGISLIYLFLNIVPYWALMKAYNLDLGFWIASAILILTRLGTVIPNAPGNAGVYHAVCISSLGLFGVDRPTAQGFATILFVVLTMPLLLGGFVAVALAGINLKDIRNRARAGFEITTHSNPQ